MNVTWSVYLVLWLAWAQYAMPTNSNLYTQLYSVMNKQLGIDYFQSLDVQFQPVEVDWDQKATQAAATFAETFRKHFDVVENLRDAIQNSYMKFGQADNIEQLKVKKCCSLLDENLEFVKEVGQRGDTKRPCVRTTTDDTNLEYPVSDDMIDEMINGKSQIDGLNTTGMKWLYFGNEMGAYVRYPATRDSQDCYFYDPRVRPWYAVTASPVPKDIVIVLDVSKGTVQRGTLDLIKSAAKTVIDTLNPDDRVGVVMFGGDARTPTDCHRTSLAYAIPATRRFLKESIDSKEAIPGNYFKSGIKKAFELLKAQPKESNRKRAMLFMTDGSSQDDEAGVLQELREQVKNLDDDIQILTYGIENENSVLSQGDKNLLKNMTLIGGAESEKNRFTILDNPDDLRVKIGRYYTFFAPNNLTHPVVTVPYVDYSGLGLIVSICLPVYYSVEIISTFQNPLRKPLQGVTCVDLSIADLAMKELDIQEGYMFIFSHLSNRTLVHPLLPRPGDVAAYASDPVFLDISILEPDAAKAGLLDKMQRMDIENMTIETTWITSRGSSARNGVKQQKITASYYFRQIKDTDFTMAIVVPAKSTHMKVLVQEPDNFYPQKVHYSSQLDDDVEVCNYYGATVSTEITSIYLTPMAFTTDKSALDPDEIEKYMENSPFYNDIGKQLQKNVKEMIATTAKLEDIWINDTEVEVEVLWKYIVTQNGAMRIYPAVDIGQILAFGHSDWFAKALDNANDVTITTPRYEDFTGRTIVISLLKNIMGSTFGNNTDTSIAVMGMDISVHSMYSLLMRSLEDCRNNKYSCFLMDKNGYIIYHDKFLEVGNISSILGGTHVTEAEAGIAAQLIQDKHLRQMKCVSFGSFWEHSTWMMADDFSVSDKLDTHGYKVEKMTGTNTYIVLVNAATISNSAGECRCDLQQSAEPGLGKCVEDIDCQCPCYQQTNSFSRCTNKFSNIEVPVCTPNQSSLLPASPKWLEYVMPVDDSVTPCQFIMCNALRSEWPCRAFNRCTWCSEECREQTSCPEPSPPILPIVVPVVILLVIIILVAVFVVYRCKQMGKPLGPAKHIPNNNYSGETIEFQNDDIHYDHIPADRGEVGHINDAYITVTNEAHDAPGAPRSRVSSKRVSCVGNTPVGPPPVEDFPPGAPQNDYLTMSEVQSSDSDKDEVVLDPLRAGLPHMHNGSNDRQSMPSIASKRALPVTMNASTLPRDVSLMPETGGLQFAPAGGGHAVVQPLQVATTEFPYAEFGDGDEDNEKIDIDEMYITTFPTQQQHSPTTNRRPVESVAEDTVQVESTKKDTTSESVPENTVPKTVATEVSDDENLTSSDTIFSVRL